MKKFIFVLALSMVPNLSFALDNAERFAAAFAGGTTAAAIETRLRDTADNALWRQLLPKEHQLVDNSRYMIRALETGAKRDAEVIATAEKNYQLRVTQENLDKLNWAKEKDRLRENALRSKREQLRVREADLEAKKKELLTGPRAKEVAGKFSRIRALRAANLAVVLTGAGLLANDWWDADRAVSRKLTARDLGIDPNGPFVTEEIISPVIIKSSAESAR